MKNKARNTVSTIPSLTPEQLYRRCDPGQFAFATTAELEDLAEIIGQTRALNAIRFGSDIQREGYNLFVMGPYGTGKHTFVTQFLENKAGKEPVPADLCYVNNFEQPHKPRALLLPAGMAVRLHRSMELLVEELRATIAAAFESEEYRAKTEEIQESFTAREEDAVKSLGEDANLRGIALLRSQNGFGFGPLKDGEVIKPEEYDKLDEQEKARIEATIGELQAQLEKILRHDIPQWKREAREKLKHLNRLITMFAVEHLVDEARLPFLLIPAVMTYFDAVQQDVIENVGDFRRTEEGQSGNDGPHFRRYGINVLVDHTASQGAPVVYEDSPMHHNLIGRVEHLAQFGNLVTDFTLIKPGSLHRANGGYLLLDARKLLTQLYAWEGLKRVLHAREIRIESLAQILSLVSTVSLEPEPVPLDVKVVLFGERILYYLLYAYDPEFAELFKVEADFDDRFERNGESDLLYARLIGTVARKEKLLPFDPAAVARVIEHSARLAGEAHKLSAHLQSVADLLREADYWARKEGREAVAMADVQYAIDTQLLRASRLKERVQEEILRGTVLIDSSGARVGQVNALSVIDLGNAAFAQPSRVTATTRLGEGELLNIEREAKLSGAIHSKGVLILSAYLASRYAKNRPLPLAASLVFEQSYGGVEGDSASVAELCALLSSLAEVPVRQSMAVTGSINQFGQVQAIGAVNEKIEGFFDICRARGLNGEQGVVIPAANVQHLMLRQDVVQAVAEGRFHVYPVAQVDEALELLTGIAAQEVNAKVDGRIAALLKLRQALAKAAQERKKGKTSGKGN
ncbi:Lon protease family protein [Sulfurimicrobium lacus]|uniref:Lon protease family protein n=1 Tax=Sulfurimicrobium lacus TaxID=2715678 RepID=UPI001563570B|nr:ATP-binding protein [Sulfurimicrobium lacus]